MRLYPTRPRRITYLICDPETRTAQSYVGQYGDVDRDKRGHVIAYDPTELI